MCVDSVIIVYCGFCGQVKQKIFPFCRFHKAYVNEWPRQIMSMDITIIQSWVNNICNYFLIVYIISILRFFFLRISSGGGWKKENCKYIYIKKPVYTVHKFLPQFLEGKIKVCCVLQVDYGKKSQNWDRVHF